MKTPFGIDNRDFLQSRKIIRDFPKIGMVSMHFKSVTHDKCPVKRKIVRADTIISGYLLEEVQRKDGKGVDTLFTVIS